ncbi:CDP-glucose 4,6-dehydratase [Pararobbsia silviterrae]|uniref:CDP-glucose 4,6-dehydratase n=1 Tax=Pararobbsia silviterrae TaxID=1792498 RepID=A0A494Y9V8_9BURK|nr:CDP-glucose 4,6-dehydratase [Pararobbsia silviterrae]RKP59414.1 CDP-glucose 4,6-dehydratase [Pararobbsia silviterrae]
MKPSFWQGRRVFLTGHTGFKGSWMSLWLQSLGAEVTGYALTPPTQPSLFELARVADGMRSIIGDVRDANALRDAMVEARPEIVFHMAAQPLVRYSYTNPVETYATNVMGTVHLLEAVRQTPGVRAVVNVTTDKCYENREWHWGYRENEAMGGHDPYSSSKGCSELVTAAYRASFFGPATYATHGVALASARAGNVIGGGDWASDRLIPDIVAAFSASRPVLIRNPNSVRPWQHVLEPVRGYMMLAEALHERGTKYAEGWNFGPYDEDAQPVRWIVDALSQRWGGDARWQIDGADHPHEATFLKLDISKARAELKWQPALRLRDALGLIVDWTHRCASGENCRSVTLDQIRAYQDLSATPTPH